MIIPSRTYAELAKDIWVHKQTIVYYKSWGRKPSSPRADAMIGFYKKKKLEIDEAILDLKKIVKTWRGSLKK